MNSLSIFSALSSFSCFSQDKNGRRAFKSLVVSSSQPIDLTAGRILIRLFAMSSFIKSVGRESSFFFSGGCGFSGAFPARPSCSPRLLHLSQSLGIAEYFVYFILNICHGGFYFPFLSISIIAFACGLSKSSFVFAGRLKFPPLFFEFYCRHF